MTFVTKDINPRYVREGDEYEISVNPGPSGFKESLRVKVTETWRRPAEPWERHNGNVVYVIRHEPVSRAWRPRWYFAFVMYGSKETIQIYRKVKGK